MIRIARRFIISAVLAGSDGDRLAAASRRRTDRLGCRRCEFRGKFATAFACSARSAISCFMSRASGDAAFSPSERALELQSDGRGWARNMVNRLCIDLQGHVSEPCNRDNVKESYLTPIDHPVAVRLDGRCSGRGHLRLVVRRRRWSAAIHV